MDYSLDDKGLGDLIDKMIKLREEIPDIEHPLTSHDAEHANLYYSIKEEVNNRGKLVKKLSE